MQNKLSFHFSAEDIAAARRSSLERSSLERSSLERNGLESELLILLARGTGTLWSASGPGTAREIMAPHRAARFFIEVDGAWQLYRGGEVSASAVRADVGPIEALHSPLNELDIPQDGVAHLAMRFFEKRADDASLAVRGTSPG